MKKKVYEEEWTEQDFKDYPNTFLYADSKDLINAMAKKGFFGGWVDNEYKLYRLKENEE